MDENGFLRGIEGEQQNDQDLTSGAEHLIRLKKQAGITRPGDNDLELEKEAGFNPITAAAGAAGGYLAGHSEDKKHPAGHSHLGAIGAVGGALGGGLLLRKNAGELAQHLNTKLAESREKTANSIVARLKDHPGLVAATGLGAILGGIGTYAASRPQADSGKSRAEEDLEGRVEAQKGRPERGLLSKMHNRNTELEHGYARAFREHPGKAAILGTATGAMGGYGIGRLAGGLAKLRGGK